MTNTALTGEQIAHFLEYGFIKLEQIIDVSPGSIGAKWAQDVWDRCGYSPTWVEDTIHFNTTESYPVDEFCPALHQAICQLVGGAECLSHPPDIGNSIIANFKLGSEYPWHPAGPNYPGYHKDGDFFIHFLDSPEQALLMIILWSDVDEKGGATIIVPDSISPTAQHLLNNPQGVCPVDTDVREYLKLDEKYAMLEVNSLIQKCKDFRYATGKAGDVYLLHPFMLHAASQNFTQSIRFITNPPASAKEPFNFNRANQNYSPVEACILHHLGVTSLDYQIEGERLLIDGGCLRRKKAQELEEQAKSLQK